MKLDVFAKILNLQSVIPGQKVFVKSLSLALALSIRTLGRYLMPMITTGIFVVRISQVLLAPSPVG